MSNRKCQICDWILRLDRDEKTYFIAELETGYVVLNKWQYFKGYTFFLCKNDVNEIHFLENEFRIKFLNEMSIISEAIYNALHPTKINCESLGNLASHVHWHIIPRYGNDPVPERPIWCINREDLYSNDVILSQHETDKLRTKILNELKKLRVMIIKDFEKD